MQLLRADEHVRAAEESSSAAGDPGGARARGASPRRDRRELAWTFSTASTTTGTREEARTSRKLAAGERPGVGAHVQEHARSGRLPTWSLFSASSVREQQLGRGPSRSNTTAGGTVTPSRRWKRASASYAWRSPGAAPRQSARTGRRTGPPGRRRGRPPAGATALVPAARALRRRSFHPLPLTTHAAVANSPRALFSQSGGSTGARPPVVPRGTEVHARLLALAPSEAATASRVHRVLRPVQVVAHPRSRAWRDGAPREGGARESGPEEGAGVPLDGSASTGRTSPAFRTRSSTTTRSRACASS